MLEFSSYKICVWEMFKSNWKLYHRTMLSNKNRIKLLLRLILLHFLIYFKSAFLHIRFFRSIVQLLRINVLLWIKYRDMHKQGCVHWFQCIIFLRSQFCSWRNVQAEPFIFVVRSSYGNATAFMIQSLNHYHYSLNIDNLIHLVI